MKTTKVLAMAFMKEFRIDRCEGITVKAVRSIKARRVVKSH